MLLGDFTHAVALYFTHSDRSDIVDHFSPTMLIVGSRGLGEIKGYVSFASEFWLTLMKM